ncbi:MAG: pyrroline-5-carboxylate reductase [Thermodesulfobacteriota bacterium]
MLKNKSIGFIGAGNMGEALIKGLLASKKVAPDRIIAGDPGKDRLSYMAEHYKINVVSENIEVVQRADIIILAVKPDMVKNVLEEVGDDLARDKLLISIAAGITTDSIINHLSHPCPVARVMPNTPALVLEGISAVFLRDKNNTDLNEAVLNIFNSIGKTVIIEDERLMDVVTGLSGSGPAFVFLFIEALTDGGVKMGLKKETASLLAIQTVMGSAKLALESGRHTGELKDMVTSPGGTTIAGLHVMEKRGVRGALMEVVEKATMRSRELSEKGE